MAALLRERGLEQKQFGVDSGVGGSMLHQLIKGHRPVNIDAATKIAATLKVSIGTFSPRLASIVADAAAHLGNDSAALGRDAAVPVSLSSKRKWPFLKIDYEKLVSLPADDVLRIEGVLLTAASGMALNITQPHKAKKFGR